MVHVAVRKSVTIETVLRRWNICPSVKEARLATLVCCLGVVTVLGGDIGATGRTVTKLAVTKPSDGGMSVLAAHTALLLSSVTVTIANGRTVR